MSDLRTLHRGTLAALVAAGAAVGWAPSARAADPPPVAATVGAAVATAPLFRI